MRAKVYDDDYESILFIRKKFIRKRGSNGQNLKKILRKSPGSISTIKCFYSPKIDIRHYCIQNVKDGIQIQWAPSTRLIATTFHIGDEE